MNLFLFYFEKNFQRQTWPPVQHLITWLCLSRDWSTHETHETLTRPLQWKHHSRASPSWSRFSIDWLPACIVERKIVPATQLEVKWRTLFAIADSMVVLCERARIFRRTGEKKGKITRRPAPHFEAWKPDSSAKVTGRIKMAEGSVRS